MPHVYICAWMLSCFQGLIRTQIFQNIGDQLCRDKECPFSGITISGRVWRKVLESNAQSVLLSVRGWKPGAKGTPGFCFGYFCDGKHV